MAIIKYLYGKKENLWPLVTGKGQLRLTDTRHYSLIKNKKMQDDESRKKFYVRKDRISLKVNDTLISPKDITSDIEMNIPTRLCYSLCFSNKKNDESLYKYFEADICLKFDVSIMTPRF